MSEGRRITLFLVTAALFGAVLGSAMSGLPPFGAYQGPYGDLVLQTMGELRHSQQGVAAVTFDYRGFDTLGEEFILFAAVAGALLLMRPQRSERKQPPQDRAADRGAVGASAAVLATGVVMFPFTLILGIYVVLHGHLTPGGGFQGGVLLASAFYFLYLSGEYQDLNTFVSEHAVDLFEAGGAASFALIAAIPLMQGEPYLKNVLPLGGPGNLASTGTIPLFNCAVGVEVGAAFLLLIVAFLKQVLVIRKGH